MDWKEALSSLNLSDLPAGDDNNGSTPEEKGGSEAERENGKSTSSGKWKLNMFYEKKGRAGKPATIITGFPEDKEEEMLDIARTLKQKLGCGGSARGGEILLQGDRREQARKMLQEMGHFLKC